MTTTSIVIDGKELSKEDAEELKDIVRQQFLYWDNYLMFGIDVGVQENISLPTEREEKAHLRAAELLRKIDPDFPFKDNVYFEGDVAKTNVPLDMIQKHWFHNNYSKFASEQYLKLQANKTA